jgi:hypothetical protein
VRHDVLACFDFDAAITAGATNYNGQQPQMLIDTCMRAILSASRDPVDSDTKQVEA